MSPCNSSLNQEGVWVTGQHPSTLSWFEFEAEFSMGITDEDLVAFPPREELIRTVKDAIGIGNRTCQRKALETLASRLHRRFQKLISRRYAAYHHIGDTHEMEDDLQRLYMYIFFGYRENSKGEMNQSKHPLLTWLENLDKGATARNLNHYAISIANSYLKRDLPRNLKRGRGNESLVGWTDGAFDDGAEIDVHDRRERRIQLHANEVFEREKMDHEETMALRRHVRDCLEQIPAEEAELLLARYCPIPYDNFTQSEYAKTKGMSEATVSRRLQKGRETLVNLLHSACPDLLQRHGWSRQASKNTGEDKEL